MSETPRGSVVERFRGLSAGRRAALLVGLWMLSGLYVVGPAQVAVVRICGQAVWNVDAGIGWRPPWPISRVDRVAVWERRQVSIGVSQTDSAVGRGGGGREERLTGDHNLVRIQATVQYAVSDPRRFLFTSGQVNEIVADTVRSCLTSQVAVEPVDALMTIGREAIRMSVQQAAQDILDEYGLGVRIHTISLGAVRPPAEVAAAFNDVNSAKQERERKINEAHGYEDEILPQALGQADELRAQAEAYRTRVVNRARGEADRFARLAAEYHRAPQVTRVRLYLEAVERLAPQLKATVVESDNGRRPIDLGIIEAPGAGP